MCRVETFFLHSISLYTWTRPRSSPPQREEMIKWKWIALIRASYKDRENCQRNIYNLVEWGRDESLFLCLYFLMFTFARGSSWVCNISCSTFSVYLLACYQLFSAELCQRKVRTIIIIWKVHELRWFSFIPFPSNVFMKAILDVSLHKLNFTVRSASVILKSIHAIKKHRLEFRVLINTCPCW